jgi:hypothetical protein
MMDMKCIVFVRSIMPTAEMLELAKGERHCFARFQTENVRSMWQAVRWRTCRRYGT